MFAAFCSPVMAEDDDLWGNYHYDIDIPTQEKPKFVTDEEFEQALQKMDSKVNKWRNWAQKLKQPRGKNFSQSNETELIENEHGEDTSLPVISLPVEIVVGEATLPVGHYQVKGEMINNKPVLSLYQAGELMTRINATETRDDFNEAEILFANWTNEDDNKIKIIYGSLDFNAYAFVEIAN